MSLYTKICVALFGIAAGIVVLFSVDMVLNSGRFVAHSLHTRTPECSGACHGQQDTSGTAAFMVLPPMPSTHRLPTTATGPRRDPLLGVSVETQGSH